MEHPKTSTDSGHVYTVKTKYRIFISGIQRNEIKLLAVHDAAADDDYHHQAETRDTQPFKKR